MDRLICHLDKRIKNIDEIISELNVIKNIDENIEISEELKNNIKEIISITEQESRKFQHRKMIYEEEEKIKIAFYKTFKKWLAEYLNKIIDYLKPFSTFDCELINTKENEIGIKVKRNTPEMNLIHYLYYNIEEQRFIRTKHEGKEVVNDQPIVIWPFYKIESSKTIYNIKTGRNNEAFTLNFKISEWPKNIKKIRKFVDDMKNKFITFIKDNKHPFGNNSIIKVK